MLNDLLYRVPRLAVAVQHAAYEIDAVVAHDEGDPQVAVHDLVDAVERVLLVYNRVQQDAQGPDVLLFAAVWFPGQDFWCSVI